MSSGRVWPVVGVWVAVALAAAPAPGDTLVMPSGARFEGRVEEAGGRYILHTPSGGRMTFEKDDVQEVIRSGSESAVSPEPAPEPRPPQPEPAADAAPASEKPDDVLLSALPPMDTPFGGRAVFSEKAFPIRAAPNKNALRRALRLSLPRPCRACRSSGKIRKKVTYRPHVPGSGIQQPEVIAWVETCPACGGYGNGFDDETGERLVKLVEALAHVGRDGEYASLRDLAAERLRQAFEVRRRSWTTYHCVPVQRPVRVRTVSPYGYRSWRTVYATGKERKPAGTQAFDQAVRDFVTPLWPREAARPPAGQAVVLMGRVAEPKRHTGWLWARMTPEKPPQGSPGPGALLLCGGAGTASPPAGKAVVGGLMVGHWQGAPAPASAESPARAGRRPEAPAAAGPTAEPPSSAPAGRKTPVVLVVVATPP